MAIKKPNGPTPVGFEKHIRACLRNGVTYE